MLFRSLPPSIEELEFRLRARGTETEESIKKRLIHATAEIKESHQFDSIIVNDSLERAYRELKEILQNKYHLEPIAGPQNG